MAEKSEKVRSITGQDARKLGIVGHTAITIAASILAAVLGVMYGRQTSSPVGAFSPPVRTSSITGTSTGTETATTGEGELAAVTAAELKCLIELNEELRARLALQKKHEALLDRSIEQTQASTRDAKELRRLLIELAGCRRDLQECADLVSRCHNVLCSPEEQSNPPTFPQQQ